MTKATVWLERRFNDKWTPAHPVDSQWNFEVTKVQNTISPMVGNLLGKTGVQALIDADITVNIT